LLSPRTRPSPSHPPGTHRSSTSMGALGAALPLP